jgi:hypothetical protein
MAHESLDRQQHIEASSDRGFGLVFAAVFAIIATWPLVHGQAPRWPALGLAALLALIAATRPAVLARANRLWTRFGVALGNIAGPFAVTVLFYAIVTPLGLLMRLTRKVPLRLSMDSAAESYWIARRPPGPPPDSLTNQF